MSINNELRRTRIKLRLLEQEGIGTLIHDMYQDIHPDWTQEDTEYRIKSMKSVYKMWIEYNCPKDPKQQRLKL